MPILSPGPSHDAAACPAYGQCNDYARKRDPTRFTTWADDKDTSGKCYEHATLISFNNYPGWYNRAGDKSAPLSWNDKAAACQSGTVAGTKGKPFVISETGAGGVYATTSTSSPAIFSRISQLRPSRAPCAVCRVPDCADA